MGSRAVVAGIAAVTKRRMIGCSPMVPFWSKADMARRIVSDHLRRF
jgi:hypothetical protein